MDGGQGDDCSELSGVFCHPCHKKDGGKLNNGKGVNCGDAGARQRSETLTWQKRR